jgi:hypothetical protein
MKWNLMKKKKEEKAKGICASDYLGIHPALGTGYHADKAVPIHRKFTVLCVCV